MRHLRRRTYQLLEPTFAYRPWSDNDGELWPAGELLERQQVGAALLLCLFLASELLRLVVVSGLRAVATVLLVGIVVAAVGARPVQRLADPVTLTRLYVRHQLAPASAPVVGVRRRPVVRVLATAAAVIEGLFFGQPPLPLWLLGLLLGLMVLTVVEMAARTRAVTRYEQAAGHRVLVTARSRRRAAFRQPVQAWALT